VISYISERFSGCLYIFYFVVFSDSGQYLVYSRKAKIE